MRPVRRGLSPRSRDFGQYKDAQTYLVGRLGRYCSYCERPILTQLAVEHIQPKKGPNAEPQLVGSWTNFLLACVNCNSTKGDQRVTLADFLLPDRDNTFFAFSYTPDGKVQPKTGLGKQLERIAQCTLSLTGLDKTMIETLDENGRLIARDRVYQRMETWSVALEARAAVEENPGNESVATLVVSNARASGFFSIWMTVFAGNREMRNRLIDGFEGTRASGCFDDDGNPVSPAPNPDRLEGGGKI